MQRTFIRPQPGAQWNFLASGADIVIYGGAAGGGKSYGLLLTPLKHVRVPGFGFTIFRKNFNQIFSQGGLWDEAGKIYSQIPGAYPSMARSEWRFTNNQGAIVSKVSFAHIDRDEALHSWQGSQLCGIGFDELTHFSEKVFFYMLSRNRSTCGVKPFVRATCNPDADSWVAKFIEWWIDQDTGYPIPERSGKIRWFIRRDEKLYWSEHIEDLWDQFDLKTIEERDEPKSVTFIMSSVYDNKELLKVNPGYLANLKSLAEVERERLLLGNWKIKAAAGLFFKRSQVTMAAAAPIKFKALCRAWDIAATEDKETGDADYTSGVLMGQKEDGTFIVLDVINQRVKAGEVGKLIMNTAISDRARYGPSVRIRIPQDPGGAGKIVANNYVKMLAGYPVKSKVVTGNKQVRATPFAAQWQNGNVEVLVAEWNDMYFMQLESFPQSKHDDMVDASSDAFNGLTESSFDITALV